MEVSRSVVARIQVGVVALLAAMVAGCGTTGEADMDEPSPAVPGASAPVAREAVADLAGRLEVTEDRIRVVSVEEVTWPNGALGCPEPGMSYTMALVDGHRVVLEAAGERYHYHAGGQRGPFLCEDPGRQAGHSGG